MFPKETVDSGARIEEVEELDFSEIKKHLEIGESIFMVRKHKNNFDPSLIIGPLPLGSSMKKISEKGATKSWYFTHV